MRIEAVKQAILTPPITPRVLASLRETARLFSTYYSAMIEGNRLTQEQVAQVIEGPSAFRAGIGAHLKRTREGLRSNPTKGARFGHGRWQDTRETHALSGRAKCNP